MEIRVLGLELCKETLLERGEKAKGDALAQLALGDDEEGEAASGGVGGGEIRGRLDEAVDEEFGLVDCLVGGFVVRDAWEDEGDERGGIGGGGGCVFGEDGGVVGDAGAGGEVLVRHLM